MRKTNSVFKNPLNNRFANFETSLFSSSVFELRKSVLSGTEKVDLRKQTLKTSKTVFEKKIVQEDSKLT